MIITKDEIVRHIRSTYKGYQHFKLEDNQKIQDEKDFIIADGSRPVNALHLHADKTVYLHNINGHAPVSTSLVQSLCRVLSAGDKAQEVTVYQALEKYNPRLTPSFLNTPGNYMDTADFGFFLKTVKNVAAIQNPHLLSRISKFTWFWQSLPGINRFRQRLLPLRLLYELFFVHLEKMHRHLIVQPVKTVKQKEGKNPAIYTTFFTLRYTGNYMLHTDIPFDHLGYLTGLFSGLAAAQKKPFARVRMYYCAWDLVRLLKEDYAYRGYQVTVNDTDKAEIMVNGQVVAHRAVLLKHTVACAWSAYSKLRARLSRPGNKRPSSRELYDHTQVYEISDFEKDDLAQLLSAKKAVLVYYADQTLTDGSMSAFAGHSPSRVIIEKGDIYNAPCTLLSASYINKRVTRETDYNYFAPGSYAAHMPLQKTRQVQNSREDRQILFIQQAENTLRELEKSRQQIHSLTEALNREKESLAQQVQERTQELETANKQLTNAFIHLAHELRTPLTLINNYAAEYKRNHTRDTEFGMIYTNIQKLNDYVTKYLNEERARMGLMTYNHDQHVNVSQLVGAKLEQFAETARLKRIDLKQHVHAGLYTNADPMALEIIVSNLVQNALKFTPGGGQVKVSLYPEKQQICLVVKDNGYGIEPSQHADIFRYFYRGDGHNQPGTGVGLALVKEIVDSLQGQIRLQSEPGQGSTFTVPLPMAQEARETPAASQAPDPEDALLHPKSPAILLIEDDRQLLTYIRDHLKKQYNVAVAGNGHKAIQKLHEMQQQPALIISDIMMPDMDGEELLRNLTKSKQHRHIPFIFLTAKATPDDKIKGLQLGAVDYIQKPFQIQELQHKAAAILKNAQEQKHHTLMQSARRILEQENANEVTDTPPKPSFEERCQAYRISEREQAVIELAYAGKTYGEIAEQLYISVKTVDNHFQKIFKKTGVNKKHDLFRLLFQ